MLLIITAIFLFLFVLFQSLYIIIPLFSNRWKNVSINTDLLEKKMTILIPAYNEEKVIHQCIGGMIGLDYENYEAIVINDGSSDQTLNVLYDMLRLELINKEKAGLITHKEVTHVYQSSIYPHIFVLDKSNGGKSDALNAGIEYASGEIVITLDADCVLKHDSLHAVNAKFADRDVVAAGGTVKIAQGTNDMVVEANTFRVPGWIRFQIVQYANSFFLHKLTQDTLRAMTVIAGAYGAFTKDLLFEVGGYHHTIGEDMDITLRIQKVLRTTAYKTKRMIYIPEAICYTECPENLKNIFNQRIRWQKAFIYCIIHYTKDCLAKFRPSVGFYLLIDSFILGTCTAFILLIVPLMILLNPDNIMVFVYLFLIASFTGVYTNIIALIVSKRFGHTYSKGDYLRYIIFTPFEIVTYRLIQVFFVVWGTVSYFIKPHEWGEIERLGKLTPTLSAEKEKSKLL